MGQRECDTDDGNVQGGLESEGWRLRTCSYCPPEIFIRPGNSLYTCDLRALRLPRSMRNFCQSDRYRDKGSWAISFGTLYSTREAELISV